MAYSDIWFLIPSTSLLVFHLSLLIWTEVVIKIIWLLNGTTHKRRSIRNNQEKVNVAQIDRILIRSRSVNDAIPSNDRFICWTEGFVTLNDLISRNVTLFNVSLKHETVSFAEFDEGYNPYDIESNPFLRFTQLNKAKKIIKIPLRQFYNMTSSLDPSSMRVVFLHHTTRSGSTMWSQIFNTIPDCAVISESAPLARMFMEEVDDAGEFIESEEFEKIVGAVIKFYTSRFPNKRMLFVKATYADFYMCKPIAKIFPDHRILFGYRDPLPSGKSWHEIINIHDDFRFVHTAMKYWTNCSNFLTDGRRMTYLGYRKCSSAINLVRPQEPFEWYMSLWCLCATLANQALEGGVDIRGLKYERVIEDPVRAITKLFEFIGVEKKYINDAMRATEGDSQKNTHISRALRKRTVSWNSTADSIRRSNDILEFFGFPDLNTEYTFPKNLY